MTAKMTSAELVALLDDVAVTVRRHIAVADPEPEQATVAVTATAGDGQVTLAWDLSPASAVERLTGWLDGRNGSDATGAGPWSVTDPPETRSRTFLKLVNGREYEFTVKALFSDGSTAVAKVKATPAAGIPGPIPPGAGAVPYVGRSGLGHNSGAFVGGQDVAATRYFVDYRKTEIDAYLTFTTRKTWDQMFTLHPSWVEFVKAGGIVIVSNPPQPEPEGNTRTAAGDHDERWRAYGTELDGAGLNVNRFVKRLGWECNGDWYAWSWGAPKKRNTPESYIAAVQHVSDALKTTAPNVRVSVNLNRGNRRDGYDWRRLMDQLTAVSPVTGQRYVDIVGLDSYDMYRAARNAGEWQAQISQDPGPLTVGAYCRDNGVQIAYEEWGPIRPGGADGTGGGDNPYYAKAMWGLFKQQADILAYEIAYEHTGTNSYDHRWVSANLKPKFSEAYLSHWRRAG